MVEDTWKSRALPILEFIAAQSDLNLMSIGTIADATSIEASDVVSEVERLIEGRYISSKLKKLMTGSDVRPWFLEGTRIAERGARTIGMWPSDDIFEDLLKVLELQIDSTPDNDTKSRLERLRSSLLGIGSSVGTALFTTWLQGIAGLH